MREKFLRTIWRDIAPVVALVLALLLTFLTRHSASVEYPDTQPSVYYQSQLWGADGDRQPASLTRLSP
jgi:hypothetical protein